MKTFAKWIIILSAVIQFSCRESVIVAENNPSSKESTLSGRKIYSTEIVDLFSRSNLSCDQEINHPETGFPEAFKNLPEDSALKKESVQTLLSGDYADSIFLNHILGNFYMIEGDAEQALKYYGAVYSNGVSYIPDSTVYSVSSVNNCAAIYAEQEEYDRAYHYATNAQYLIENAADSEALVYLKSLNGYVLGNIYYNMTNYQLSKQNYIEAFQACPNEASITDWYQFMNIYYKDGDNDASIEIMNYAEKYMPNNANSFMVRAQIFYHTGDYIRAWDDVMFTVTLTYDYVPYLYENAVKMMYLILQNTPPELAEYFQLYAQAILYKTSLKDYSAAQIAFEKLLEMEPTSYHCYLNLAEAEMNLGNLDRSLEYLDLLKRKKPEYAYVYFDYGLVYQLKEDYESAEENLYRCMELDPEGRAGQYAATVYAKLPDWVTEARHAEESEL